MTSRHTLLCDPKTDVTEVIYLLLPIGLSHFLLYGSQWCSSTLHSTKKALVLFSKERKYIVQDTKTNIKNGSFLCFPENTCVPLMCLSLYICFSSYICCTSLSHPLTPMVALLWLHRHLANTLSRQIKSLSIKPKSQHCSHRLDKT